MRSVLVLLNLKKNMQRLDVPESMLGIEGETGWENASLLTQ